MSGQTKKDDVNREFATIMNNAWKVVVEILVLPLKLFVWVSRVLVFLVNDIVWVNLKKIKGDYKVVFTKTRVMEKEFEVTAKKNLRTVSNKVGNVERVVREVRAGSKFIWHSLVGVVMLPVSGAVLLAKDTEMLLNGAIKSIWRILFFLLGKMFFLLGMVYTFMVWLSDCFGLFLVDMRAVVERVIVAVVHSPKLIKRAYVLLLLSSGAVAERVKYLYKWRPQFNFARSEVPNIVVEEEEIPEEVIEEKKVLTEKDKLQKLAEKLDTELSGHVAGGINWNKTRPGVEIASNVKVVDVRVSAKERLQKRFGKLEKERQSNDKWRKRLEVLDRRLANVEVGVRLQARRPQFDVGRDREQLEIYNDKKLNRVKASVQKNVGQWNAYLNRLEHELAEMHLSKKAEPGPENFWSKLRAKFLKK